MKRFSRIVAPAAAALAMFAATPGTRTVCERIRSGEAASPGNDDEADRRQRQGRRPGRGPRRRFAQRDQGHQLDELGRQRRRDGDRAELDVSSGASRLDSGHRVLRLHFAIQRQVGGERVQRRLGVGPGSTGGRLAERRREPSRVADSRQAVRRSQVEGADGAALVARRRVAAADARRRGVRQRRLRDGRPRLRQGRDDRPAVPADRRPELRQGRRRRRGAAIPARHWATRRRPSRSIRARTRSTLSARRSWPTNSTRDAIATLKEVRDRGLRRP